MCKNRQGSGKNITYFLQNLSLTLPYIVVNRIMKKSPDLVALLALFFVVGSIVTGVSHADFSVISAVSTVLPN